ncbi:potassium ABC transporter ATPase, partial [Gordonia sihwensis]
GRAAALRPPAPAPARPTITATEPEPAKKASWRWPVLIIAVLAIIGLLVTAFFVVRSKAMASTFVTAVDGNVEIYSGTPDNLLFFTVRAPKERVCVDDLTADSPTVRFQPSDSTASCTPMKVDDLTGIGRSAVTSNSIKNNSLESTRDRVRGLEFLPKCAPPEPPATPKPEAPKPGEPRSETPRPETSKPEAPKPSGAPKSGETSSAPIPTVGADGHNTCRSDG